MRKGKVIVLCGLIGSGKSTLSKELAEVLGANTLWQSEPDEKGGRNPYLSDYYTDPVRWATIMQMHLLSYRFRQHKQAQWYSLSTGYDSVTDSSYYQDTAFARLQLKMGLMSEREFETYKSLYQAMTASVMLPTICIRVLVSPETCNRRLLSRMEIETGRKCETAIDLDYLRKLEQEIDHMVGVLRRQGVTILDVPWDEDRNSPEERRQSVEGLAARINNMVPTDEFLDMHRRAI
jgi:deoxyadenosine/deoxycytidine kinase